MKALEMKDPRNKEWALRKARVADAKALSECMRAAYASYGLRLTNETLPPLTVNYEDEIRAYPAWVAESDGRLVGGLILIPEKTHLTVANAAVHPQFQGNGLGRAFMDLAEAEAKQRGYTELRLATHVAMPENVALYAHLGWSETHRVESRIYMQKSLI